MDCQCPLWIYGNTKDGHVPRQSVGTTDLAVAEAQRQADVGEFLARTDISDAAKARVRDAAKAAEGLRSDIDVLCADMPTEERAALKQKHEVGLKIAARWCMQTAILIELYEAGRLSDVLTLEEKAALLKAWESSAALDQEAAAIFPKLAALATGPKHRMVEVRQPGPWDVARKLVSSGT